MEENRKVVEPLSKEALDLLMKSEIEEIFPKLDMIPESIATTFEAMIRCYLLTKEKTAELEKVRGFKRLGKVFDEDNRHVCFFKASEDAKKEAAVYLLDHPLDSHRSSSSDLIGFGGATPTGFIKTKEASGCLISFVEHDRPVGKFSPLEFKTLSPEIQKLCIFHIRFGSADCHGLNILSKIDDEGIHRLTPIDHEECFTPDFVLRRVWWEESKEADEAFSEEMVRYVDQLDVDRDIDSWNTCGWNAPSEITVPFKIFTFFLKQAVQLHLTGIEMLVLAQDRHKYLAFNLPNMVHEKNADTTDEAFLQKAKDNIEKRLREYVSKFRN